MSLAADQLLPAIADEVERRAMRLQRQACRLEVARRRFDSGAMDAVAVALAARFNPDHLRISRPGPVGEDGRVPAARQMPVA